MLTADEIIARLGLRPHPEEGGFFVETYRSGDRVAPDTLPARYSGDRAFGTAIYYLLTPESFSTLHWLASDEIFHFYLGDPVEMVQLLPDGSHRVLVLGSDIAAGMRLQVIVPPPCGRARDWPRAGAGRSSAVRSRPVSSTPTTRVDDGTNSSAAIPRRTT